MIPNMEFAQQCRAGSSIDAMLASGRTAEAEKAYYELLERVLATKKLDIFVISKITLGLLLALIQQDRESDAAEIWTMGMEDGTLGMGVHGLEIGQTSTHDLMVYFLISAHLQSLNPDPDAALRAVDDFMTRVCTYANDNDDSKLRALAINNWRVHLLEIHNQGAVPEATLQTYKTFATEEPQSPRLRFPDPSPWVVDWNGEDDQVHVFSPDGKVEQMSSSEAEDIPAPKKRGFLSKLFGGSRDETNQARNSSKEDRALDVIASQFEVADADSYSERGMAFLRAAEEMQLGDAAYERAVDDLKRSIDLDAKQPGVYSNLGMAYSRLSRPEMALQEFSKAIELMPEEPQFFVMRAMVHARLDDDTQAVADLSTALVMAPNDRVMFNRANAYRRLGELENAMADYRKIIETTNNPQVKSDAEHNLAALTE